MKDHCFGADQIVSRKQVIRLLYFNDFVYRFSSLQQYARRQEKVCSPLSVCIIRVIDVLYCGLFALIKTCKLIGVV